MQPYRQKIITKIIKENYNGNRQSLNAQDIYWSDVLRGGDWSKLTILNLGRCNITDENIFVLLKLNLPELANLDLENNKITVYGARQIALKNWPHLIQLQLSSNNIEAQGMITILNGPTKNLVVLILRECSIMGKKMHEFINSSQNLTQIKKIDLSDNIIGNTGAKLLVRGNFPNLQELYITHCLIYGEGFKHLTKGRWPKLILFNFSYKSDETTYDILYLSQSKQIAVGWLVHDASQRMEKTIIFIDCVTVAYLLAAICFDFPIGCRNS